MARNAHILLVDDEPALRAEICYGLEQHGYAVTAVSSVGQAEQALEEISFDLALLDITMPERDGWTLLPQLVEDWQLPVIVLTANADVRTRVRSFKEGAADYISKPFFVEEVVARIKTRLRLSQLETHKTKVQFADCCVDLEGRTVALKDHPLALTEAEFDILAYLVARPSRAVSRATLAENALPQDGDRNDRTVDSHVSRLRSKLGDAGKSIKTVWGIGWRFETKGN